MNQDENRVKLRKIKVLQNYSHISNLRANKLRKLCRVCGIKCPQNQCYSMREEHVVKPFLEKYLNIQINKNIKKLPHLVCKKCTKLLIDWNFTVKTSQALEIALSTIYKNPAKNDSDIQEIFPSVDKPIIEVIDLDDEEIQNENNLQTVQESTELIVAEIIESSDLQVEKENSPDIGIQEDFLAKAGEIGTDMDIQEDIQTKGNDPGVIILEELHTEAEEIGPNMDIQVDFHTKEEKIGPNVNIQEDFHTEAEEIGLEKDFQYDTQDEMPLIDRTNLQPSNLTETDRYDTTVNTQKMNSSNTVQSIALQSSIIGGEIQDNIAIKIEPLKDHSDHFESTCNQNTLNTSIVQSLLDVQIKTETDPLRINFGNDDNDIKNIITNSSNDPLEIRDNIIPSQSVQERGFFCPQFNLFNNESETTETASDIIDNQITFNLTNHNDIIKISKFPKLSVSIKYSEQCIVNQLKKVHTKNTDSRNLNFFIITYLRSEIKRSSIKNDTKISFCIICKKFIKNLFNHLQDSHAENPNVNHVLNEENSNIQNKILNSVLRTHKTKKLTDSESKNNIKKLCYSKILELLPENISKIIKNDTMLNIYGLKLIEKSNTMTNTNLFAFVSNKLEQLVNLLLISKELNSNINNLTSLCTSDNCDIIMNAIRKIGEFNVITCTYKYPNIVNEIGIAIKQYTKIAHEMDINYEVCNYESFISVFNRLLKNEINLVENSILFDINKSRKRKSLEGIEKL